MPRSIAASAVVDKRQKRIPEAGRATSSPRVARLEAFNHERWAQPILAGDIVPALVTFVPGSTGGSARVRIGEYDVELKPSAFSWTRRTSAAALFKVGDLIEVNVRALEGRRPTELTLEQPPAVEGALVAIDNRTGQIRAMVGGFSFARSKFNRATQARRQVGSLFKPFVFTAAIDRGFTSVSTFIDEPVSYEAGPNQPPYRPLNYDRKYRGPRDASARARTIAQHSRRESHGGDSDPRKSWPTPSASD